MKNQDNLYFTEYHPEAEASIVFLHGGGSSGWMWQPVIEQLPEYHCLVPDLPEHGGSVDIKPFSMVLAAQKTCDLIRSKAHNGKAVVVGLSEGAQVVVQMLADCPEVMNAAMISSALLLPMPGGKVYSSRRFIAILYQMSIPPFRNNEAWIKLNMKYAAGIPDVFFPQFKTNFQNTTESQFVNLMVENQSFRMPDGVEKAKVKTLVGCGSHEYKAMKESAKLLSNFISESQLFQINLSKGSSLAMEHNWALTTPKLFSETLKKWLTGNPIPAQLVDNNQK